MSALMIFHFNKAIPTIQPGQRKLFGLFCVKKKTRTLILREAVRVRLFVLTAQVIRAVFANLKSLLFVAYFMALDFFLLMV